MGNQFLITPSKLPDPPKEKTIVFKNLAGGLNLLKVNLCKLRLTVGS